ncbi:potassium voltage-gated channel subfamily G member 2 isoform X1 [Kogia breviceps]|uniref:potassium voltage-gated channel subfamily G member 2 isoform X1 n=1 Tax=Kogia breviceps TaxID=27615 RepID=UPI0034D25495
MVRTRREARPPLDDLVASAVRMSCFPTVPLIILVLLALSPHFENKSGTVSLRSRLLPSRCLKMAQPPDPGAVHGAMALPPGPAEPPGPEPPVGGGGLGGARARHVIINVGGCRVRLAWAALARCPLARLERLRACRGHDELLRVCDDYDVSRDEFFFDRSPCAFRAIVALLRAGKLRLLRGACALAFRDELAYWGIDEARLERCCLRHLRRREEEAAEARAGPAERGGPGSPACAPGPGGGRLARGRRRLRDVLDDPRSGPAGKLFACVSVAFVAVTAVGLCLSTMPDIRAEEERGECSPKCRSLFVLETVCVAWFSFEFLLRSLQAESKCAFLRTPLNIIDILAILPFYVSLLVGLAARRGAGGSKLLERAGLGLRLLRALRVLYVMRLARHSLGLRSLGLTVRRCARQFGLLLLFLCVAMALFAPLVHLAERELGARRDFSSVPASYWWAVISMTTVGYGDMVPRSLPGQVVALSSILSGILLMAFPVTSIFHTFSRSYSELKAQQQRAASAEPALREDSTHSASAAEDDGSQGPDGTGPAGDSVAGPWAPAGPP